MKRKFFLKNSSFDIYNTDYREFYFGQNNYKTFLLTLNCAVIFFLMFSVLKQILDVNFKFGDKKK